MRAMLALTVAMGVLILVGSSALVALLIKRSEVPAPQSAFSVTLDEPPGTHITSLSTLGDHMALQLQGGGPDRVLLLDPRTGGITGRIALQR